MSVGRGLGAPSTGVLPPLSWACATDIFSFTRDREKAKALLDAAGDPDTAILRRVVHTYQAPPKGFKRGRFSDPDLDAVLDRASVSTKDVSRVAVGPTN